MSNLLTPCCRVLLEHLTGLQLVKKFPAFHGTPRFITALTCVRHLSLSWASPIQSTYPHPTSWSSILILSTHLRLGLPSGLFPSGFPTKKLYTPSPHPHTPYAQPISSFSMLSKNLKIKIYSTIILPVVLYGCETWSMTLREERKLRVFENMVLRKIFEPRRDEVTGEWRRLHNEELNDLYSLPNIVRYE